MVDRNTAVRNKARAGGADDSTYLTDQTANTNLELMIIPNFFLETCRMGQDLVSAPSSPAHLPTAAHIVSYLCWTKKQIGDDQSPQ